MDIKLLLNDDKDGPANTTKAVEKTKKKAAKKTKKAIAFCRPCNEEFGYKQNYYRHLKRSHIKERRFSCFCGKKFFFKCDVRKHQGAVHYEGREYPCLYCWPTSFGTKSDHTKHMVKCHPQAPPVNL